MTTAMEAARTHVDETMRTWLGLPAGASVPALPDTLARRLLRVEEYEQAHRDQWGNWEFGFCEAYHEGRLWRPDVDEWLAEQRRELGSTEALWPDGRPFAICLSHDVDLISDAVTPRQALRSMRVSLLDEDGSRRERVTRIARPGVRAARALYHGLSAAPAAEALERCVELERELGVTASYFFTSYPAGDGHRYDCVYDFGDPCRFGGTRVTVADVIRTVHAEGFDVGLHGSYNSALVAGRLTREKEALERATGLTVTTTRQHFVHWDIRTTPQLQAAAGFAADSTLGFNRNIGLRAGTSLPFRWFDLVRGEALALVQVPLLVHDGALLRPDALELGLDLALRVLRDFLGRVADVGGVGTLVVHPNNLERPDYLALFRSAIDYGLERGAWFASIRDLERWWRGREARA